VSLTAIAAASIVMLVAAWHGARAESEAALQLPWLVSGGLGGIAVLGASLALLNVHLERRRMASDRVNLERVISETRTLVELLLGVDARGGRAESGEPSTSNGPSV
jgi:NhaP-type Na+/H+ or K+/H+ antiporter